MINPQFSPLHSHHPLTRLEHRNITSLEIAENGANTEKAQQERNYKEWNKDFKTGHWLEAARKKRTTERHDKTLNVALTLVI